MHDPGQVIWLDLQLAQIERTMGYEQGRIGIEAHAENATGLDLVTAGFPCQDISTAGRGRRDQGRNACGTTSLRLSASYDPPTFLCTRTFPA